MKIVIKKFIKCLIFRHFTDIRAVRRYAIPLALFAVQVTTFNAALATGAPPLTRQQNVIADTEDSTKPNMPGRPADVAGLNEAPAVPISYRWQYNQQVVGETVSVQARADDNFVSLAHRFGFGYDELLLANPSAERWITAAGSQVNLPGRTILPLSSPLQLASSQLLDSDSLESQLASDGYLVANLPERRLYVFRGSSVTSYPIGIGQIGWNTPLLKTRVTTKLVDPSWKPPASIRKEANLRGEELPDLVLPGPDNPMGTRAIQFGNTRYYVHGTNRPSGIGKRVSHGCLRMWPVHIEAMYDDVGKGMKVEIVNQPVKAGWSGTNLFVEVHPPLAEDEHSAESLLDLAREVVLSTMLDRQVSEGLDVKLLDRRLQRAVTLSDGTPHLVAHSLSP